VYSLPVINRPLLFTSTTEKLNGLMFRALPLSNLM
jgi:hypothetical protein